MLNFSVDECPFCYFPCEMLRLLYRRWSGVRVVVGQEESNLALNLCGEFQLKI